MWEVGKGQVGSVITLEISIHGFTMKIWVDFIEQRDASGVWFYREGLSGPGQILNCFRLSFFMTDKWTFLSRYSFPALLFDYKYMEWHHPTLYQISVDVKRSVGGQVRRWLLFPLGESATRSGPRCRF